MSKKIKILAISIILLSLGIWSGQNIGERSSSQRDDARKAIFQPESMRGESADVLQSGTRGESGNVLPETTKNSAPAPADTRGESGNASLKAVLQINDVRYESEIAAEASVYDLMTLLKNEGEITFTETTYIGMGKLITGINSMKSGGERTWIYYVNGTEAEVGVSNYKIKPGDVCSWKYEEVR